MRRLMILLSVMIVLTACAASEPVPFSILIQGGLFRVGGFEGTNQPDLWVIESSTNIDPTLQSAAGNSSVLASPEKLRADLQQVDYTKYIAVLILTGQSSSTTSSKITQVQRNGSRVTINLDISVSDTGTAFVSDPYYILTLSRAAVSGQAVQFDLVSGRFNSTVASKIVAVP